MAVDQNKETRFRRFWRQNRVNLLVGLVICMVICVLAGLRGLLMPMPLWLALGLFCWLFRVWLVYLSWRRGGGDRQDPES